MIREHRKCTFAAGLLLLTSVAYAQSSPATTKGTAIGETINAAITAALPGVSAIDALIATLFKNKSKQTLTPADVKTAAASQASKDEAAKSKAANDQLASLQSAITEIASANELAGSARTAETSLARAKEALGKSDWDSFKIEWGVAKTNVEKVQSFDSKKLGQISNENVQDAWNSLSTQYEQWKSDVDQNSGTKNLPVTLNSFTQLETAIHNIATIPSVELRLIAAQLGTIKAAPAAGPDAVQPPPPAPPTSLGELNTFIRSSSAK